MNIQKYVLKNVNGVTVEILNYGGIISRVLAPDKNGLLENVVIGFADPESYLQGNISYLGALIGRFANRIARGKFSLDGVTYQLAQNNGKNALHGGIKGFDKVFWKVEETAPLKSLKLSYVSPDMSEGYPGELSVVVTYSLDDENRLEVTYEARTSQATPVNLTQHSYFNLSAKTGSTILDHELILDADSYVVVDSELIPTGEIRKVERSLDFQMPKRIGDEISEHLQGYDHCYVLRKSHDDKVIAKVRDLNSGRTLEVTTTEPGIQFYSGFFHEPKFAGLCLEAQHFPDSPNQADFPNTILRPGETYRQTTTYRFGIG